ncbi:hypothetical protein FE783_04935 [Paenibacillus mesophilus]|uniref:hypothetical protein n=1 Tax=Paenibacillus mesophilus TaxID=2582849 RepID=UPI00110DBE20|nr:hypothetical protein [Paenibacillus mesophilus]TMV52289.1 hypothetical protein FE783_04935 [Paenibacillus mesophilus]
MVQFEICSKTGQWSRFTDFYVEHRTRIIPGYKVSHVLTDVQNYMKQGRGAILVDGLNQVIGIGCFVLGLKEEGFKNKEIAVLGNCYFKEEYQNNRTFIRGLQVLADQIWDANRDVKEVRIPTSASNVYTNRLYGKIAAKRYSYDTGYGTFHVYSTPYSEFADYCDRFR